MSEEIKDKPLVSRAIMTALVLLLLLFAALLAFRFIEEDRQDKLESVHYQSRLLEHAVKRAYAQHLQSFARWGRYWHEVGDEELEHIHALMEAYREDHPELRALAVVRGHAWLSLTAENESLWLSDPGLPRRHRNSIEQAQASGKLAVPHDFSFPDGEQGAYLYLPIGSGPAGADVGMLAISLQRFMTALVDRLFANLPVQVVVRDEKQRVIYDSHPDMAAQGVQASFLLDPDDDGYPWEFVLISTDPAWSVQTRASLLVLGFSTGLLLLLLALVFRESARNKCYSHQLLENQEVMRTQMQKLEKARESLNYLLYHEESTGLPNRVALLRDLQKNLRQPVPDSGRLVGIQLLNLDSYREVYGYESGMRVLQAAAARMETFMQQNRINGRLYILESESFLLWLPQMPETFYKNLEQQWLEWSSRPLKTGHFEIHVQLAMGVVFLNTQEQLHPERWLQRLEVALNQAVMLGPGSVIVYRKGMLERARRRMELGGQLLHFLRDGHFHLYYQPVMELRSGKIRFVEAFMRLQHPDIGAVSPTVFIPMAEANGVIKELEQWAIRQACQDWKSLSPHLPEGARLELNVSFKHLLHEEFYDWLLQCTQATGLSPTQLCLDLTRELEEREFAQAEPILRRLHDAGIQFALDIESPRFNSLTILDRQPLSLLKIDRTLVMRLLKDDGVTSVVHAMMELADQLDLELIAEGVESHQVDQWLRDVGCQYSQGHFYYSPLPLHTLTDRLAQQNSVNGAGEQT